MGKDTVIRWRGGLKFRVSPERAGELFGAGMPNWADPSDDERAELVKGNPRRKIWRVRQGELEVYVKRYEHEGLIGSVKSLFRNSPVAAEFGNYRRVRAAGVGCPEPLAFGQRGFRGMAGPAVLITAAVPGAVPLEFYLGDHRFDDELVSLLGRMLGRLHRAGLIHPDLHLGNLVVSEGSEGRRKLVLFDLQKLGRVCPASLRDRWRLEPAAIEWNLACCFGRLSRYANGAQQERFLRSYLVEVQPGCSLPVDSLGEMSGRLAGLCWKDKQSRWAKRDLRARRTDEYFAAIRLPGRWTGSVLLQLRDALPRGPTLVSGFTAEQWIESLSDPLSLFAGPGVQTVKESGGTLVVRRSLRVGPTNLQVWARLIRGEPKSGPWLRNLSRSIGVSQAQQAYETGFALLRRFISTVLPLAWLSRRESLSRTTSILITEALPEAVNLQEFLQSKEAKGFAELKELSQMAGELAGDLLGHGFVHRDFQPGKMLLQQSSRKQWQLLVNGLGDIDRRRRIGREDRLAMPVRAHQATANWAGLGRTMRLRFLLKYLERISEPRDKWKEWWRGVGEIIV